MSLGGLGQCHHGLVEIDAVTGCDLVAGDHIGRPCLDRTERTSLDARNLDVTGDRIASHSEVMLQS
jgi:hypothetical protein